MREALALSAVQAVRALRKREISPLELLDAVEERLDEVEPAVNAMPIRCLDRARRHAGRLMSRTASGPSDRMSWLAGLPVSVKDIVDVSGLPTTHGSSALRHNIAATSDPLVERIERFGGIVVGKTNTPEFCSGADTANSLFGRTANPWDTAVSCGASSGGAAVSVATGEVWCAHGEDTAGSIRIPASFVSAVGLRPSPGVVSAGQPPGLSSTLGVHGPIARDVADAALFFGAMAGPGDRWPATPDDVPLLPRRVAFTIDYGGTLPVDPEVDKIITNAVGRLRRAGCEIEEYAPDLGGMHDACLTLMAYRSALRHSELADRLGDGIGAIVRMEVDAGRALSADRLIAAERERADFGRSFDALFDTYDVFVTPTFGCPPWALPTGPDPFPDEPELLRIMAVWPLTTVVTMAACPAVSVPCGRTAAGLPVGLQLIGRTMSDTDLLRIARAVEEICGGAPALPVTPVNAVPERSAP